MRFSVNRYRLLKYIIPLFLALYLGMVLWKVAIGFAQDEIFPFFSWDLFSENPAWHRTGHGVIVHSVYGEPVSETAWLIPNDNPNGSKALRRAVNACRGFQDCDESVAQFLYPPVQRLAWQNLRVQESQSFDDVEFSIVQASIHLRDLQENIRELASGEIDRVDLFRTPVTLGRWRTVEGRVWPEVPQDAQLVASPDFDIYYSDNTLLYAKSPCKPADVEARFFLHIFPADVNDLPRHRRIYGYENLNFSLLDAGESWTWMCVTARELPEYEIDRILTGQFVTGQGRVWEAEFALNNQPGRGRTEP